MRVSLQFFVNASPVGLRFAVLINAPQGPPKQGLFQLLVLPAFRQGPPQAGSLSAPEVPGNGTLRDRTASGDLLLAQPQLESESQNFFEFSHGQLSCGQRIPPR